MAGLASRLAAGEPIGGPEDEGYLPRGLRSNVRADRAGAVRAIDLLLAKLAGDVRTEVGADGRSRAARCTRDRSPGRPARARHRGGVRAAGQPRSICPTRHANVWLRYPIDGVDVADARGLRVRPRRVRHDGGQRRSEPVGAARRRARAGAPRIVRLAARRRSTRPRASTRRWPPPPSSARRSRPSCGKRRWAR